MGIHSFLSLEFFRSHFVRTIVIMAEITPVTEWPDYSTTPTGGDVMTQDVNAPYDKGDLAWLLVCTCLCWQITPAIGFPFVTATAMILAGAMLERGRLFPSMVFL